MESIFYKIKELGADFKIIRKKKSFRGEVKIEIKAPKKLKPIYLQTLPYPGFPTDLQAPFSVVLTQAEGKSKIFEVMYEKRLSHLKELRKMGAQVKILNDHEALVFGATPLKGKILKSLDIRFGATTIIAALIAEKTSKIFGIDQIERGYFELEKRLQNLGAEIKKIEK